MNRLFPHAEHGDLGIASKVKTLFFSHTIVPGKDSHWSCMGHMPIFWIKHCRQQEKILWLARSGSCDHSFRSISRRLMGNPTRQKNIVTMPITLNYPKINSNNNVEKSDILWFNMCDCIYCIKHCSKQENIHVKGKKNSPLTCVIWPNVRLKNVLLNNQIPLSTDPIMSSFMVWFIDLKLKLNQMTSRVSSSLWVSEPR